MSRGVDSETKIGLTTTVDKLPGIGLKRAHGLASLGLTNLGKLIAHLPMRHEVQAGEAKIAELKPGQVVSARGDVTATRPSAFGRRPRFEAVLTDETGRLDLVWFNQNYLQQRIHAGARLRVQGELRQRGNKMQIANPRWELLPLDGEEPASREERVRPVYPASERVKSWEIETSIAGVLDLALPMIEEHLPESFRRERNLPTLAEAYRMLHKPATLEEVGEGRRRLAYDELLMMQLGVFLKRMHLRETLRAPKLDHSPELDARVRSRFPFTLTEAQDRVVGELVKDLTSSVPTNRLIQGDVGSGKTVVALYAMLLAVASGHQAALMAPTEILAEQHFASISRSLEGSRVRVELLTGAIVGHERESLVGRLERGEVDLVIGTHALVTERVAFRSLAVAVIDEQHRFGVEQRAMLRVKGSEGADATGSALASTPHVIVMTATPIPRTLGITLFGDLDISTIDALPPGRTPIETRIVMPSGRAGAYGFVRERLEAGEQAYVVVPTIEGSGSHEDSDGGLAGVRSLLKELEAGPLQGRRLAAMHGKLRRDTREHVMERFRGGRIDCLVATTVIEVGVDVPNATVMVVEHADRFGLAQLHQLRGRVGRGRERSYCLLIGEPKTPDAIERLKVLAETNDGFVLAEKDLEIRGPGEVFGSRQSGASPFKVADLMRDRELLAMARRDARGWIERSPALSRAEEATLRRRLFKVYGDSLGLGDVG
ncbi:MAG: ATP-dependent DNA helicase RecG [Planctomycetota bacterium]|nr:ATP-dependent DNA helicase RecG [Planctomycetota bacterium]